MLLLTTEEREDLGRLTLVLRREEAEDLVEKLGYLLAHPDYHHDHLEDFANDSAVDLVVVVPELMNSYDEKLRKAIGLMK